MKSKDNNQTDNMANEKKVSSARGGTTENYSRQPAAESTGQAGGGNKQSQPGGSQQSGGGMGSPRTERGAGTGGAGQSQADLGRDLGSRQSQGGQGSQQSGAGGAGGGGHHQSQPRGHKGFGLQGEQGTVGWNARSTLR
jgi:hypothetical protein